MPGKSPWSIALIGTDYARALAAFKNDCNENLVIARRLREHLSDRLIEPILDVGAGSGQAASLAFPDRTAILIDKEPYQLPANPKHKRIIGDLKHVRLDTYKPNTIVFCHSIYSFSRSLTGLSKQLIGSGARNVLVVANECKGILEEVAHWLVQMDAGAFGIQLPGLALERKMSFSTTLTYSSFETLANHIVRILFDLNSASAKAVVERRLQSDLKLKAPTIILAEAIYCFQLSTKSAR